GEGDRSAGFDHARALGDELWLVGDMAPGLLADDDVEGVVVERHLQCVPESEIHQVCELGQTRKSYRAVVAAAREIETGDPAANSLRKVARRTAHAAAHIEHVVRALDADLRGEDVVGLDAAEMILIVLPEDIFAQAV